MPIPDIVRFLEERIYTGSNLTPTEVYAATPTGWHFLLEDIFTFQDLVNNTSDGCEVFHISVQKGLLRISGSCVHPADQRLFNRLVQSIARDSATVCMECGSRKAFRRKMEVAWPALCAIHYVEYVNYLDTRDG